MCVCAFCLALFKVPHFYPVRFSFIQNDGMAIIVIMLVVVKTEEETPFRPIANSRTSVQRQYPAECVYAIMPCVQNRKGRGH